MMDYPGETILRVDGLHKLYARRPSISRRRLRDTLVQVMLGRRPAPIQSLMTHEFWALNNVSFELKRGEALGIIGLNGSGKTTLLRILAGQLLPDRGEVWLKGSSAAMIDLTAGFQQNASGRENIFLRGAALGFPRSRMTALADEIIAFSELGDAIDAPVATYSSGMKMRLAFSVMTTVQPDILFIDEILAVGDFRFRQKCLAKIRQMRERSSFVLVSHNMNDITQFCDRAMVVHRGHVQFLGAPDKAVELYETLNRGDAPVDSAAALTAAMGPIFENPQAITDVSHFWCDAEGNPVEERPFAETLYFSLRFTSLIDIRRLVVGIPIWNMNAQYLTGLSTQINSDQFDVAAGETVYLLLEISGGALNPGRIKSMVGIVDGVEFLYRKASADLVIDATTHPTWGAITLRHSWTRRHLDPNEIPQRNAS